MARVNIEAMVWTDPRFRLLAEDVGIDRFSAIARVALLWAYCTDREVCELRAGEIDLLAEIPCFGTHLCGCGLAERTSENLFRIKGTEGRIEWLTQLRKNGAKGGRPPKPQENNQKVSKPKTKGKTKRKTNWFPEKNQAGNLLYCTVPHNTVLQDSKSETKPTDPPQTPREIFETLWTHYAPSLKAMGIRGWSDARIRSARARWNEQPDKRYWEGVIRRACQSKFCRGEIPPREGHKQFRANIDWFLRPGTHIKISEGLYDDEKKPEREVLEL